VLHPVVEKNHVFSVPTFPSAQVSGTIVQFEGGVGAAPAVGAIVSAPAHSVSPAMIGNNSLRAMIPPRDGGRFA
jgi:hypothetical protein